MKFEDIIETAEFLESKGFADAQTAIVLGTGLGRLIEKIEVEASIGYDKIPHFPVSTVEFHAGKLICGKLSGQRVIAMQGRFHLYEGYSLAEVTFPIRVFKMLGVSRLILSNAAGSINPKFKKGDLMLIDDHINLQGGSPLTGLSDERFGQRFTDLAAPYDTSMRIAFKKIAEGHGIILHEGVYACVHGPHPGNPCRVSLFG